MSINLPQKTKYFTRIISVYPWQIPCLPTHYTVQNTVYTVKYTMHNPNNLHYTTQFAQYNMQCKPYTVIFMLHNLQSTLYTLYCTGYSGNPATLVWFIMSIAFRQHTRPFLQSLLFLLNNITTLRCTARQYFSLQQNIPVYYYDIFNCILAIVIFLF